MTKYLIRGGLVAVAGIAALGLSISAPAGQETANVFPPWQGGKNNDTLERGLVFSVPEADNLADFHGDPFNAKLILYVGGNYFFAMAPLVAEFERENPEYKGHIYWETIPPGLLVKQIEAGGTVTVGNMTWTAKADAYFAGLGRVKQLIEQGLLTGQAVPYVTNTLTIMVPKENPAGIRGLADLGRPGVRLVMPNPEFEGIGRQAKATLAKAGGESLVNQVYGDKVADGSTILTRIHHRQSPVWLMQGRAEVGITWQSEAIFQEQAGHPITHIPIADAENTTAIYAGAQVMNAPHPEAAKAWLDFVRSQPALAIFKSYGFKPYKAAD